MPTVATSSTTRRSRRSSWRTRERPPNGCVLEFERMDVRSDEEQNAARGAGSPTSRSRRPYDAAPPRRLSVVSFGNRSRWRRRSPAPRRASAAAVDALVAARMRPPQRRWRRRPRALGVAGGRGGLRAKSVDDAAMPADAGRSRARRRDGRARRACAAAASVSLRGGGRGTRRAGGAARVDGLTKAAATSLFAADADHG